MNTVDTTPALSPYRGQGLRLLLAILLVALNLRGAITSVGPLLESIQARYALNGTAAGLLTSLPLFAFGFLSAYAAPLAKRHGIERAVFVSLLLTVIGMGVRYVDNVAALYSGTLLIGIGIAFNNVLLPGLLRRDFPQHLAIVTGTFTLVLVTFGGIGSGIAFPLSEIGGWRFALVAWAFPAIFGLAVWLPQLKHHTPPKVQVPVKDKLWSSSLAWQVSLFMGCQSTAFYVMIAWFPSMMSDLENIDAARSGWILFLYQVSVMVSVMAVPLLIQRTQDQRWIGTGCGFLILLGFFGLFCYSHNALLWMLLMGLGAGGSLVLALTMFGLRTSSASQTVALSGMAQAVGYTMAAFTPILIGFLHDVTHYWTVPLLLMIVLSVMQVACGYFAGRQGTIEK